MQIITSTGFGDSGSSAVTDLLSEYNEIKAFNSEWECTFLHAPDGLSDLEAAVREGHRLKVDYAVNRFLSLSKRLSIQENYINAFHGKFYEISYGFVQSFFDLVWNGMYEDRLPSYYAQSSKKDKKLIDFANTYYNIKKSKKFDMYESDSWRPSYVPCAEAFYYTDINRFYDCTKKYIQELINEIDKDCKRLYLDQLLPPISVAKYLNYFPCDTKVFIVDKDPRDLFIVENVYNGSRYVAYENVDTFIKWYRATRKKSREDVLPENKLYCMLDELVYDYDNSCHKIENFLNISPDSHVSKLSKFDPEKSCVNTRLYLKYDNFTKEVLKIEKELEEYLYNPSEPTNKETNENKKHFENPIVNVITVCNNIQKGIIKDSKLKISLNCTTLVKNISLFKERKSIVKIIKGIVKICLGIIAFLPQFVSNLIKINMY